MMLPSNIMKYARTLVVYASLFMGVCTGTFAGLFNPQTFTLSNGLQVIVLTNTRAPIVKQILVYKVGAIDEPLGKSGIAHFLEHLMFKGTKNLTGAELDKANERMGADQNASTGHDYTMYYQEIVKNELEFVMKIESDRMQNLLLLEKDVQDELPVILEERRMRTDNEPAAILNEAMNAAFYRNHPYRIPTIGWEYEIQGLTQKDARDFYDTWYAPNNAVLILAGDISVKEAKSLAEKYYGGIPAKKIPERKTLSEPLHRGVILHVQKESSRVLEPVYNRIYTAPSLKEDRKAYFALQILEHLLAGGAHGQLYENLVNKQKVAAWAGARYNHGISRGPASFQFSGQPGPGKTIKELEESFLQEIKVLMEKSISSEVLEKAKRQVLSDIDFMRDESFGGATIFAHVAGAGADIQEIEAWKDSIEEVSAEDVNAVIQKIFNDDDYITGHLLPEKKVEKTS